VWILNFPVPLLLSDEFCSFAERVADAQMPVHVLVCASLILEKGQIFEVKFWKHEQN